MPSQKPDLNPTEAERIRREMEMEKEIEKEVERRLREQRVSMMKEQMKEGKDAHLLRVQLEIEEQKRRKEMERADTRPLTNPGNQPNQFNQAEFYGQTDQLNQVLRNQTNQMAQGFEQEYHAMMLRKNGM